MRSLFYKAQDMFLDQKRACKELILNESFNIPVLIEWSSMFGAALKAPVQTFFFLQLKCTTIGMCKDRNYLHWLFFSVFQK